MGQWLIYGANGYTGRLIAEQAVQRGMKPVLAGRNHDAIGAMGKQLGCPTCVFGLLRPSEIAERLTDVSVVLHCAGPFSTTAVPMMEACLASRTHYLDITGEIDVIDAGAQRDQRAKDAGVMLMPAVGFDVVPTDCLALALSNKLPDAKHLELAWRSTGLPSRGTAKTTVESMPKGGRARIDSQLVRVPVAWKSQEISFRNGRYWAMTIPWGDVCSAYYTTGIPNIDVYMAVPPAYIEAARRRRRWLWLSALPPVQWWMKRGIDKNAPGPTAEQRAHSGISVWGRVTGDNGRTVEGTLELPDGYDVTWQTALAAAERVLAAAPPVGFQTPSRVFGERFICELPGVDMQLSA